MSIQQRQPSINGSYNNRGPVMYSRPALQLQASRNSQGQPGTYQAAGGHISLQSLISSFHQIPTPTKAIPTAHMPEGSYAYSPRFVHATKAAHPRRYRQEAMHRNVQGLESCRGSYLTNESAPGTPFHGLSGHRDHGTVIAVVDSSFPQPLPCITISDRNIDALAQQHSEIPAV
jgi:hypothetical protein